MGWRGCATGVRWVVVAAALGGGGGGCDGGRRRRRSLVVVVTVAVRGHSASGRTSNTPREEGF